MAIGINRTMQNFGPLKDQAERITGVQQGLLSIHQSLGTVFSAIDTAESARAVGGVTPQGFEALRKAVGDALAAVDAAIGVAVPQMRISQTAIAELADQVNAYQMGLQRPAASGQGQGGNGNGSTGFSH